MEAEGRRRRHGADYPCGREWDGTANASTECSYYSWRDLDIGAAPYVDLSLLPTGSRCHQAAAKLGGPLLPAQELQVL